MSRETLRLIRRTIQPAHGQAWHGGPTPVGALRGVSAAQARWTPPGGRQSIWRLTLHIAYWKYTVRRHLEGGNIARFPRSPANFPALPARPDEAAWKADRELLGEQHRLLLLGLERLDPARLRRRPPGGKRWTWEEMVIGVLLHDVYHTGQIQMLKRMWSRGSR
jgi:DinB superfamily